MASPFTWPVVEPERQEAAFAAPPSGLPDAEGLAASIGPELTRLFGVRAAARALPRADDATAMLLVAELHPAADGGEAPPALELLAAEADLALLLDLLFGGGEGEGPERLPSLPPASASWMALAGFLALAASRSLAAIGYPCGTPATIPPRPLSAGNAGPQLWLTADFEGKSVRFGLRQQAVQQAQPDSPALDVESWQRRARERALGVTLPVSLRIAGRRLPMGEVARLGAGAILPLDRPGSVEVLVGGQPFARIPASQFIPPASGEEENP